MGGAATLFRFGLERQLHDDGVRVSFRNCPWWLEFIVEVLRFVPINKGSDADVKQRTLPAQTKGSDS